MKQSLKSTPRIGGFTLLELILVMGLMALMIALIVPAFKSGSPRRSAVITLKGTLETARSVAIRDQTEVYIAFTDDAPKDSEDKFSHYAVFQRVKANRSGTDTGTTYDLYFSNQLENLGSIGADGLPKIELRQIVEWTRLPDGVVFGIAGPSPTGGPGEHIEGLDFTMLEANADPTVIYEREFEVPPRFSTSGGSTMLLPFMMFNREGRLGFPQFFEPERHYLAVVEGFIDESGDHFITSYQENPGTSGQEVPRSEVIGVNLYSGRVRIVSQGR